MLNRLDKEKLYIRLTEIFLTKIQSGEWRVGAQIPTEEDLCRGFDVSKITIRRAIENLAVEGYLEKLQGKGTFVRQGPPRSGISMKTTLIESVFQPADADDVKVHEKRVLSLPDEEVLRRMGPVTDRDFFYLKRLKIKEGVPVLVNELYVPLRVCPDLKGWDEGEGSVFDFLKKKSGLKISKVAQCVEVARPGLQAPLLKVRSGSACIVIHRSFFAAGDASVAYSRTTARGDRFRLDSEFTRL